LHLLSLKQYDKYQFIWRSIREGPGRTLRFDGPGMSWKSALKICCQ